MHKQCVFLASTGADGTADVLSPVRLIGEVRSITYITDNRVPYEAGAVLTFAAESGAELLRVTVNGRDTWIPDSGSLNNERIRVTITNGGKGKSGSFVVTCQ